MFLGRENVASRRFISNVPEIIEFSEDDLEDESEKNEGQEETDKALREVVHRGE